ncbi:MAG: glycosyltransferase family 2 protein [Elusimicrobiota bacterium]
MTEVSVVIPCLNEELCIEKCVAKALHSFQKAGLEGEVIVVDNGSTDKSVEVATKAGARVVQESLKGYGSALRRGIEEAKGRYIVMADGDDTYDFLETAKFVELLRKGNDLVMGSRFRGNILPGAMTWSHRYVGNPILSGMLKLFFGGGVSDAHCGLRAFTKDAYNKMSLHTTGMEFASEMVIHAMKKKLKITEIPITYYPRQGESKLASFRDAWRHIRFMLLYSPSYMFVWPGIAIFVVSIAVSVKLLSGPIFFLGRPWDIHVMVFCSMFALLGWQILNTGLAAKAFSYAISLEQEGKTKVLLRFITLERSLLFGSVLIAAGLAIIVFIFVKWAKNDFGQLSEIKSGILSLTLIVMGLQTVFNSFLVSMFQIKYKS